MTIQCTCLVQEGQIAHAQAESLRVATVNFARQSFGAEPEVNWIEVPKGSGFTEGKPSTSVLVSMNADRALSLAEREPLLRELGQIWEREADRSPDEVVTVISDPQA
ncbi:hypothetical protein [Erythrobacter sp. THAF29]|uniref:hypothetical protein n=1 Tax=Erythrobacter sp. THAF29 TaxID=2587851 RepID=UPI00126878C9|nr:hypothetical protein [Erythrobacter sp. THAF29]QFT78752.1 hypothetical protein FIU90_14475 [Erythrobacter sp. THAF29]